MQILSNRFASLFTRGNLAKNVRIHREFERWVDRTPDAPAVIDEERVWSYRELNERANQLATFLRKRGIGPGAIVATCFERSLEFVVAQLGVLKAGAASLPIAPDYPVERIRFMLDDSDSRLILAQRVTCGLLPEDRVEIVCIDNDWPKIRDSHVARSFRRERGGELACVIYTSGTTGKPKGTLIAHRGVVRLVKKQDYVIFLPGQRFLLLASPAFDAALFEVWGPLMSGGCCVVFRGRWMELTRLETVIETYGVTCMFITTSLFNQILDLRPQVLDPVLEILVGGEALSVGHMRRARLRWPDKKLSNAYGPTECTTFACVGLMGPGQMRGWTSVPIGRPIRYTECHIVDEMLRPVAAGEPGELLLGGEGLALGYLKQPRLTAERFIQHPWSADPAARLYRTGDRCRWLSEDRLELLGRMDDQVKLRGFRIELTEIETVAQGCDGVAQAVAALVGCTGGRRQLVLFLVPDSIAALDPEHIRGELQSLLPEPMVPAYVEIVSRIPLNANGKTDRTALTNTWAKGRTQISGSMVGDGIETRLIHWWRILLQRPELEADADFFSEGGDSLLAAQLAHELQNEFGRPVQIWAIFAHPTPARLVAYLSTADTSNKLQGSGDGAPLFYVPELYGVGRLPPLLIQQLHGKRRYYDGLQFPGVVGGAPMERVEDLAEALHAQVTAIYPEGPLSLYGFSFGGLVAYELARLFALKGRKIELVVLGDTIPAGASLPRGLLERNGLRILDIFRSPWRCAPGKIAGLFRAVQRRVQGQTPGYTFPSILCRTPVTMASYRAYKSYTPAAYAGRVALVKCEQQPFSLYYRNPPREDFGWRKYATGSLTVRSVPGGHMQMFEEEACAIIGQLLDAM